MNDAILDGDLSSIDSGSDYTSSRFYVEDLLESTPWIAPEAVFLMSVQDGFFRGCHN
jgi:hypothetical protein